MIDTASNTLVGAPIAVGSFPQWVAVNPAGTRVYVANNGGNSLSVIDTASNTVVATVTGLNSPDGVVVSPDGARVYVANSGNGTVSVIDTTTNTIVGIPIFVGIGASGIAVTPAGAFLYVTQRNNPLSRNVTVISTATNTVVGSPIVVGGDPNGVAVNPAGTRVYVAGGGSGVSVIDTATNSVVATVPLTNAFAYGNFIGPGAAPPPPSVAPTSVPTMRESALALLAALLAFGGIVALRQRRGRR